MEKESKSDGDDVTRWLRKIEGNAMKINAALARYSRLLRPDEPFTSFDDFSTFLAEHTELLDDDGWLTDEQTDGLIEEELNRAAFNNKVSKTGMSKN